VSQVKNVISDLKDARFLYSLKLEEKKNYAGSEN
jgi:hypothetical protein